MAGYNANGELVQTSYFDKEAIAMRTDNPINPKPVRAISCFLPMDAVK